MAGVSNGWSGTHSQGTAGLSESELQCSKLGLDEEGTELRVLPVRAGMGPLLAPEPGWGSANAAFHS